VDGIVVGVDGSPGGDAALRWAVGEARLRRTTVHAVHAFEVSSPALGAMPVGAPGAALAGFSTEQQEQQRQLAADTARAVVTKALERTKAAESGVEVDARVVEGEPGRALADLACDAELLVVGSHGHGAVHELLLGSVSHACTRHARCPVVVMPPVEGRD
jgi:nucleotide-binding universal stress UspA family protein